MRYSVLFLILLCFSCKPKDDVPVTFRLHDNWQFKKVTDTVWKVSAVPGNVFSDLLGHQLIEDPFIGNNEKKVQWVSEEDWEYKTTFFVAEKTLEKKHLELNFEGLDTYASVFLNDSLILKTNNAFREYEVDVKPFLKPENELRILFESTSKYEDKEKQKLPYKLPEGERIFTRKAQFQYGWDWGPKLNTSGIWRPIKLVAWNDLKIQSIDIAQLSLNKHKAELHINLDLEKDDTSRLNYDVYINDSLYHLNYTINPLFPDFIPLSIKNPNRWWPHNLGEPYLYDIKVMVKQDDKILDSISLKKGLRTIELVTKKDSIGESFYFKVNHVPVYAKGANYIPQNSFQNNVNPAYYEKLLTDVVDANMNMLRVWGGGIYEDNLFYDLCDEKGILVWQDFMFACAMYPGDEAFLQNVEQEAIDNIKRLRNHASIALWCGNNENSEGWKRWGWQDGRREEEKEEIWDNYLKLFDSLLPQIVRYYADVPYWESSPKYGRGNPKYKTEGDAHDWWIWHDAYPFEHLEANVPRFMSEFGFQSLPSYQTIKYINQSDAIEISSEGFKNHQKHLRGFELIDTYMKRDFPVTTNPEDYVYMSQLVQAYGITKGVEAQRRAKPYNMGTLFWQLNDCWPAVSWSSIDYFGNWKALHYKVKQSFENVLVSLKVQNNILKIWILNDGLNPLSSTLKTQILDLDGQLLGKFSDELTVKPSTSTLEREIPVSDLSINLNEVVILTEFNGNKRLHWLVPPKNLKLKPSQTRHKIRKVADGFIIELESTTVEKDVFLFSSVKGHFSDNVFDILPNETRTIHFKTDSKTLNDLQIKSFNNFIR